MTRAQCAARADDELASFTFRGVGVRTVAIEGAPWFIAADVANILGYSATSAMTRSLDDDEKGVQTLHTPGGDQSVSVISEPGVFAAILRSTVPGAREFKRWVTHEVLPQIRRTGSYAAAPETPEQLMARALIQATATLEQAKTAVAELTPRAEAWDQLAGAGGDYDVADTAKMLARTGIATGRQRLFGQLAEIGWIYRGGEGHWRARQTSVDVGYLAERAQSHHHPRTGELVLDPPQVRVTLKGIAALTKRLGKKAIA